MLRRWRDLYFRFALNGSYKVIYVSTLLLPEAHHDRHIDSKQQILLRYQRFPTSLSTTQDSENSGTPGLTTKKIVLGQHINDPATTRHAGPCRSQRFAFTRSADVQ